MDPNATLAAMLAAIGNRDSDTIANAAESLETWIERGGFLPDEIQGFAEELAAACDEFPSTTGRREIDETEDADGVEFRVYIRPDGSLELAIGDPCYDIDHRVWCGAGVVVKADSLDDCRAATMEAFWEAVNECACSMPAILDSDS